MSDFNTNNPDLTPTSPESQPNAQPIPPQQAMGQPIAPPPPPPPPPPYMEQMPHPQSTMSPYQQPPQYQPYQPQPTDPKKPMAIAALILGIVSIIFSCLFYIAIPCGIIAIILGAISSKSMSRGMAITGIILGSVGIFFSIAVILLAIIGVMGEAFNEFSDFYY